MIIHRNALMTTAFCLGIAAMAGQAQAKGACPGNLLPYHGTCVTPGGNTVNTWGPNKKPRGGFYRVDRDEHRRKDGWLPNPERYGLPRLPRGQHYEIINGRVVRMYDNDRRVGDDNARALQGLLDSFLR